MPEAPNSGFSESVGALEVSREELNLATEIMLSLVKTSKAFRMYLPNNPLLARFTDDLKGKLVKLLSLYGDLRLDVEQFELSYKGKVVYQNNDPKESMAFKMHSDGIRFIILSEGIEEHELCAFLEIIGKDRPNDLDDDIVTLLWEKDLPHISYILAEDFLEFESPGTSVPQKSQQDKIRGIYQSISDNDPVTTPMLIPQKILTLSEEETAWLKKAREAEEVRKPLEEVIQILTSILKGEKDPEMFGEFLGIMAKLTEDLAYAGEIRQAFSLVRFLGSLSKDDTIPFDKEVISGAVSGILSERVVPVLVKILDGPEQVTPEELLEVLHVFGRNSLGRMCEILIQVEKMKARKTLLQALVEIGQGTPEAFFPFLSDSRWYVVRNMVFVLTRIRSSAALDHMIGLISHKEPAVRKEVLIYLEKAADPKAKTYLLKFLRDDSSTLRIRALQILGGTRCTFALKPIASIAASEQFAEKGMAEKKAFYEVMGVLGGEQMIPLFRNMLMKKFWFNKTKEKDSVICAVAGLARIRTPSAVKLLEEAGAMKNDELKAIITHALQTLIPESARQVNGP